ncbi:MAG: UTP--glucose-1-phosphate uridylyltransferase GalU [Clostridiales bacterium]|nr:UTP--glucose-1-phosphate uridylyltransferase GalU [Clostridiales bacterium]
MKIKKAVIPAAGLGTRLLPVTKVLPKEMLPIVDKPTIQFVVEEVVNSGIKDIIIITGRNKRAIEDHFDKSYELEAELERKNNINLLESVKKISNLAKLHYVRQKESLGLGHAVYCAKSFIGNEPFAILSGDDIIKSGVPCIKQLIDVFEEYNSCILGVQKVLDEEIHKYGCVECDLVSEKIYKVKNLFEKPKSNDALSDIAILGRYVVTSEIFSYLEITKPDSNGEIQLTDALKKMLEKHDVYAYNFVGKRYDIGDKMGYLSAIVEHALSREDLKDDFKKYLNSLTYGAHALH